LTLLIAAMVIASACIHPFWNLLIKGDQDRAASWWLFTVMLSSIGGIVCLVRGADFLSIKAVLPLLAMSIFGQYLYGLTLIRIYEKGDLSAYYPIVRASPVGVVILGFAFQGNSYGVLVLMGIALSVIGGFWLQKQPGRRLLDDPGTLMMALICMMSTAIYSVVDSQAVKIVAPEVMFFWVETSMVLGYLPAFYLLGHRRLLPRAAGLMRARPVRHLAAGALAYASYMLILAAYSQGGDVAAVTTVRQLSIPVSVVLGALILKETLLGRRFAASLLLVSGIVLVILGST
jgi:drug/metabolite transporter (DMT)-like permease